MAMTNEEYLNNLYNSLKLGMLPDNQERVQVNAIADQMLSINHEETDPLAYNIIILLIKIGNIIYRNAANVQPILEDDKYDRLMNICKKYYNMIPQPFTPQIEFQEEQQIIPLETRKTNLKEIVRRVPDIQEKMFWFPLVANITPPNPLDFVRTHDDTKINKRSRTFQQNYGLCGTLEKCKFVINSDAQVAGLFEDPGIAIFERDFLKDHIDKGIVDPNYIEILVSS